MKKKPNNEISAVTPKFVTFLFIILSGTFYSCQDKDESDLFRGFVNPPAEARPFVRWWWNGNRITGKEIQRQLDVMKDAGIGGVEINPIAMPPEGDTTGTIALKWLSPEWNSLIALASREAESRGMITDLIVGSGWPFGGEFLAKDEVIQRVIINSIECSGGELINESFSTLVSKALKSQARAPEGESFLILMKINLSGQVNWVHISSN